jgi:alpha-beta hydrolase superfamily lysophospholipase
MMNTHLIGCLRRMFLFAFAIMSTWAADFREVSFETDDGGKIYANLYGDGEHAVVLAHGAVFDKESWHELASKIRERGLSVLAIDFRGYGESKPGKKGKTLELDILGAVDYLKDNGAERVSLLGASIGGGAVGRALVASESDAVDRVILLAAVPVDSPERLKGDKLFIVSEGDRLAKATREQHKKAPGPKKLNISPGDAHAQHLFKTDQADVLKELILSHLTK